MLRFTPTIALSTLVFSLGVGCAKSHLGDGSDGGDPQSDGGVPELDGSVSDGGDERGDAGLDGGVLPEAQLVFARQRDRVNSLYAVGVSDLDDVRRLDPEPRTLLDPAEVVGYGPDGTKLVLEESHPGARIMRLSYRCRQGPCGSESARLFDVLRIEPASDVETLFAPDGSGVLFYGRSGAHWVVFGPSAPEEAITLTEREIDAAEFVAGSRAILAQEENPSGMVVFDLDPPSDEPFAAHALTGVEGRPLARIRSVAPGGMHWTVDGAGPFAFAAEDVLAGDLGGRELPSYQIHGGTSWLAFVSDSELSIQRWDGSETIPISEDAGGLSGCGDRLIFSREGDGMLSVTLPGDEAPESPLPEVALEVDGRVMYFTDACRKVALDGPLREPSALVDLDDGSAIEHSVFGFRRPNPQGTLVHTGSTYLTESLEDEEPVMHGPRKQMGTRDFTYGHQDDFVIVSAPIEHTMEPGLFRIGFEDAPEVSVSSFGPTPLDASTLDLTPDDRYLAFRASRPDVPVTEEEVALGVYEMDLQTGELTRVAPIRAPTWRGVEAVMPIPGRRALLVSGRYEAHHRMRLYVADPDEMAWIPQVPIEPRPRILSGTSGWGRPPFLHPEGSTVWYPGVDAVGPAYWAQPLRFAEDASLEPASALRLDPLSVAYAPSARVYRSVFVAGLGVVYHHQDIGWLGIPEPDWESIHRFEPESGEEELIAEVPERGLIEMVVDERGEHLALVRWNDDATRTLSLIEPGPPVSEAVIEENVTERPVFLEGERWMWFCTPSDGEGEDDGCVLHLYDLETKEDHLVSYGEGRDVAPGRIELHPEEPWGLLFDVEGDLYRLDLTTFALTEKLGEGIHPLTFVEITRDRGRVAWRDSDGVHILDVESGETWDLEIEGESSDRFYMSPSGRWIVTRRANAEPWHLWDGEHLDRTPVALAESFQHTLFFNPSETHVAGWARNHDLPHSLSVWALDDPATPHHLAGPTEVDFPPHWIE